MDETLFIALTTDLTSRKSPWNISAPSARNLSDRSSIWRTKARTGTPRASSFSATCRPVLPCVPPAAEVTRTSGLAIVMTPCAFRPRQVPSGTTASKVWYRLVPSQGEIDGDEIDEKTADGSPGRNLGPAAHPRRCLRGVQGRRLRGDQHAGDCDARAGLEARALRVGWQQAGNARGVYPGTRQAASGPRRSARAARPGFSRACACRIRDAAFARDQRSDRRRRIPIGDCRGDARA